LHTIKYPEKHCFSTANLSFFQKRSVFK
jgi:hypothetical protein